MITLPEMPEHIQQTMQAQGLLDSQAFADEKSSNLQRALPRVSELVLNSLSEMASQPEGREQVWHLVQEAAGADASAATPVAEQLGAGLVKTALADRYHGTVHTVAAAAGLRAPAVAKLFDTTATVALGLLGKQVAEQHWNAQQLAQWLRPHQAEPVVVPVAPRAAAEPELVGADTRPKAWLGRRANWLLLGVSFIAVAELGYILGAHSAATDAAATATTVSATDAGTAAQPASGGRPYTAIPINSLTPKVGASAATVPVPVVLKLKDGVRQVIGASSTESKLYQFLIDPSKEIDAADPTGDWIGFDRIYFDSNKATLTNESLWQLSNVASILKRFPDSKIKIGGYTDNSGRPLTNLALSKARAQAALDALVGLGVPASRLTAVGYGELDNIASNDTEEGRSVNRRVSMQVTEK